MRAGQCPGSTTAALLLTACLLAAPGFGADATAGENQPGGPWLGFGIGAGHFPGAGGVAGHVDAGWDFGTMFLSTRLAAVSAGSECILCPSRGDRTSVALLLGRQWVGRSWLTSLAAGAGRARGQHLDGSAVGLALEARLMLTSHQIGFGIYGFGDVNSKSSFFGVDVAVRFGGL